MTREQFISHVEDTQKAFRRFLTALCCGDPQLADDIAQESYIKAYLASDTFSNPDRFNAWIYRIAYNTFLNYRRGQRPALSYDAARESESPDRADSYFKYQELYQALAGLPAKERTSILLFYMENYSIKEIAEIEQTTQDAVKQHLSRGRRHLRGLLSTES